jgi:hypothetical protein
MARKTGQIIRRGPQVWMGRSRLALTIPRRSPFTRVMPPVFIATSVPVPMVVPTSAVFRKGRSSR